MPLLSRPGCSLPEKSRGSSNLPLPTCASACPFGITSGTISRLISVSSVSSEVTTAPNSAAKRTSFSCSSPALEAELLVEKSDDEDAVIVGIYFALARLGAQIKTSPCHLQCKLNATSPDHL